ncbi:MAG: TolC family protein, partial [Armatimonadota bacterium]
QVSASALAFGASTDLPMQTASSPPVMPSAILNVPDRGSAGSALMLMTPLYTGGRLGGMIRSAQEQERSRQQRTEGVKLDAAFLVKTAYRRVLFTRAAVDVYQELVRAAEERVRVARERYAAGSANLAEVLRNQTALADALQRLASARAEAETALVGLKTEMGVSLASEVRLVSAPDRPPIEGTVDDALARALRSRPEIVEAEAYLKAAEADLAAAKALYRPQVYLSAMHSLTTAGGSSMKGAGVGLTVSIPVADGGSRSAEVDKATARVEVARQRLEAVKLRVAQEVSAAWLAAKAAEVNVGTSEAAVQQAEEDYRIAQLRYEAGKSINVEVIDALAALVQARTNHVQALYEFGVAKDKLERAVGGM